MVGRHEVDNRWIVSYSPLLSKTCNAHINVEFCNSVKSIKYVCKCINKWSDAAMFSLQKNVCDEDTRHELGRYIDNNEAFLAHLENGQRVYFINKNAGQVALNPKDTSLTEFFKLCEQDNFAKKNSYL